LAWLAITLARSSGGSAIKRRAKSSLLTTAASARWDPNREAKPMRLVRASDPISRSVASSTSRLFPLHRMGFDFYVPKYQHSSPFIEHTLLKKHLLRNVRQLRSILKLRLRSAQMTGRDFQGGSR
jgi:hypothetical protein